MGEISEYVGERKGIAVLRSPAAGGLDVVFDTESHTPLGLHLATLPADSPPLKALETESSVRYYTELPAKKHALVKKRLEQHPVLKNPLLDFGVVAVENPFGEGEILIRKQRKLLEVIGKHVDTLPKGADWPLHAIKSGNSMHYFFPFPPKATEKIRRSLEKKYWKRPKLFKDVH